MVRKIESKENDLLLARRGETCLPFINKHVDVKILDHSRLPLYSKQMERIDSERLTNPGVSYENRQLSRDCQYSTNRESCIAYWHMTILLSLSQKSVKISLCSQHMPFWHFEHCGWTQSSMFVPIYRIKLTFIRPSIYTDFRVSMNLSNFY